MSDARSPKSEARATRSGTWLYGLRGEKELFSVTLSAGTKVFMQETCLNVGGELIALPILESVTPNAVLVGRER